jgi:hypothetical protein
MRPTVIDTIYQYIEIIDFADLVTMGPRARKIDPTHGLQEEDRLGRGQLLKVPIPQRYKAQNL